MLRFAVASALAIAATGCGGASLQTITLVNKTPRTIQELYVSKTGAKDRGPSRGTLAPGAKTTILMAPGGVDIYAVGDKIIVDQHTRETPEASATIELTAPISIVFDDSNAKPSDANAPGAREVTFQIAPPKPGSDAPGSDAAPPAGDAP